jgi:hypothetical protein
MTVVPSEDGFDLDMAVAQLGANSTDVRILFKVLVNSLAPTLGSRLEVERAGRFKKSDEIKAVQVALDNDILRAEIDGPTVRCVIGHSSGGIRIRSDQVDIVTWLKRLLGGLQAEATQSEAIRLALEHIMIGGPS